MQKNPTQLKILYLITKSNFGGAQRYVYDLATNAQKLGHEVVVGFGGEGALKTKLEAAGIRTLAITYLQRDIDPLADLKGFFRLIDIYATEAPDVIHLNSSKMGGLGALAARTWNGWTRVINLIGYGNKPMRIIFTGHGWTFNEDRSDLSRLIIGCAHWITIMLTHKTIAVSKRTQAQISKLPFVKERTIVIHNGVGKINTLEKNEALKEILGEACDKWLETKPLVIGTLAELHKNKGLTYAIEGLALLSKQTSTPFIFLILGEGEEHTHLDTLITKLGLEHKIFLAGYKEEGVQLLSAFDVFLLPSITEAFPYAILEAGNVGLPVIATAVGGIPEIIDDMQSGILIQSKNPGEVARAIGYMIEHPERQKEFGTAISERIRGRFNVETMVTETLATYV